MCIVLPNALRKLSADGADNNNGRKPKHPQATGGITAPRFPNVILLSQNVRGYSSEQASSKKDHIVRILRTFSDTPSILFTQETWSDNDQNLELDNTLFFSHALHNENPGRGGPCASFWLPVCFTYLHGFFFPCREYLYLFLIWLPPPCASYMHTGALPHFVLYLSISSTLLFSS